MLSVLQSLYGASINDTSSAPSEFRQGCCHHLEDRFMDNDDKQIGRILSRREALAMLGVAGAGVVASRLRAQSGGAPAAVSGETPWMAACVVTPAQTEGPYFVDEKLNRVDIRSDPGTGKVSAGRRSTSSCASIAWRTGRAHPCPARWWTSGSATPWACTPTCAT